MRCGLIEQNTRQPKQHLKSPSVCCNHIIPWQPVGLSELSWQAVFLGWLEHSHNKPYNRSNRDRNSYFYSMELCSASTMFLLLSLLSFTDGALIRQHGFWRNWSLLTWIPIVTGAGGGVAVGLVTKYTGSVRRFCPDFWNASIGDIASRLTTGGWCCPWSNSWWCLSSTFTLPIPWRSRTKAEKHH